MEGVITSGSYHTDSSVNWEELGSTSTKVGNSPLESNLNSKVLKKQFETRSGLLK